MSGGGPRRQRTFAVALALVAVVLFALGAFYMILPASQLPPFVPGRSPGESTHLMTSALFCWIGGVILMVVAALLTPGRGDPVREAQRLLAEESRRRAGRE